MSANSTGNRSLGEGLLPSLVPLNRELLSMMFWFTIFDCFSAWLKSVVNDGSTKDGATPTFSMLNTDGSPYCVLALRTVLVESAGELK